MTRHFNQRRGIRKCLLALTCLLGAMTSSPAFSYELVDLGPDVAPMDINNFGIVVGSRNTTQYPTRAFRYDVTTGQFEDLDGTVANSVNDAGQVAGSTLTGAFLLDGTNLRTWDEHGAYGINEIGQVSGNQAGNNPYRNTSIPYNPAIFEANKWTVMDIALVYPRGTRKGVYADIYLLDEVNDNGFAVGSRRRYGLAGSSAIMIAPPYSKISSAADVQYLPTPSGGVASAINNSNLIVGTSGNNSRVDAYSTAYVYDAVTNTLTMLGTLSGLRSSALDINEFNTVVGSSDTETDTLRHASIRNADSFMEDLNGLVDTQWVLMSAVAINEMGDIVGTGQLNGQNHGFLLVNGSAPPPPSDNNPPVATADADTTSVRARLTVNFTSDGSTDPDGDSITYLWDFGDGTSPSTAANPTHIYNDRGTYVVVLRVTDEHGLSSDSAPLQIKVRRGRN